MSIQFRCRCGSLLFAETAGAGQPIRCPMCFELATVPLAGDSAPGPEAKDPPVPIVASETVTWTAPAATRLPGTVAPRAGPKSSFPDSDERRHHVKRLNWMAGFMVLAALMQLVPVCYYGDWAAPLWMRTIVLLSASEIALAMWITLVPDWSTLWIATLAAAAVSACQAFALALAVATPVGESDVLEMNNLRDLAQLWLTGMLLLSAMICFACGQISFQWRKEIG